jgi:flagellar hook-associated protein 1
MSLFSSLQVANNSLIANQIGVQVTGNNIANANTPGYLRQEVHLTPAPTQRFGGLLLGLGVEVSAIIQKTDAFLEERLRGATADLAFGETQEQTYSRLEAAIGELSETDLSTSLTNFFGSIQDVLNQPESVAARNLATLQGQTLADDVTRLHSRVFELQGDLDKQIRGTATTINGLLKEVAKLNVKITSTEGGDVSASDAVGLRDQRNEKLKQLATIIDVRSVEQNNGAMNVFIGGDLLVYEGTNRSVYITQDADLGSHSTQIRIEGSSLPLGTASGKLGGMVTSRDEILGGFLNGLDDFTKTLAHEFNKLYSSGQGLKGFTSLTSEFDVDDIDLALDQTGLAFTPVNGSFQVLVKNTQTGITQTADLQISLDGLGDETSLAELTAALDAIDGISAAVTPTRGLQLSVDSPNLAFSFANDTSGILSALGLNTFFTGTGASNLGVSSIVREDPSYFAASSGGIGNDTENAIALAGFLDRPLASANNDSLNDAYDRLLGDTIQASSVSRGVADGFRVFHATLEGQKMAVSGVSLDEEAINLIQYQRAYQATARVISTISELLEVLVNL